MTCIYLKKSHLYFTCILLLLISISTTLYAYGSSNVGIHAFSLNSICQSNEKIAYLTFDDGPTKKVTPKVLDILEKYHIKASFFILGSHAEAYPEIIKRIYQDGHFIGNHGYSHNNKKMYQNKNSFIQEIKLTDQIIGEILGIENFSSNIFRFPNGSTSPYYKNEKKNCIQYLSELNYDYIDWNALNKDSEKKYSKSALLNNLKKSTKGKETLVILMHDTGDVNNTYDVLEDSIQYLLENGYEFKTLEEFSQ